MTFSNAMKKIQPLEVTPMLGSAPSSPTSLKLKLSGRGWTSTGRPSGPVTKTLSRDSPEIGSELPLPPCRQPDIGMTTIIRAVASASRDLLMDISDGPMP